MRHQPRDEVHVAAQPIELGDQHRALRLASLRQRSGQLRPPIERVGTLTRFDLDMLGDDLDPLGLRKALNSGFLSLDP
jgi:hypothetical protein